MAENGLPKDVKMRVLALMARGEKNPAISETLRTDYGIDYSTNKVALLRHRNQNTITEMEHMVLDAEAAEAEKIRSKSLRMLSRKLDRATADEVKIMELDQEYRDDKIDLKTYRRRKMGLLSVSIKELTLISESMHDQTKHGPGAPGDGGSSGSINLDATWLEKVMIAVQKNDILTITQLTLNQKQPHGSIIDATPTEAQA